MSGAVDVWKATACGLAGILITGASAWLVFGQDKVTQGQMTAYVSDRFEAAPWILAEGRVTGQIESNAKAIDKLQATVSVLIKQQQQVTTDQAVLVSRVDSLVTELGKLDGR